MHMIFCHLHFFSNFPPPLYHPCISYLSLTSSCAACPEGEQWRRRRRGESEEEEELCERSCQDIYSSAAVNCSHSVEGCVCQDGLYRNTEGRCVIPALCPCSDREGVLRQVTRHLPSRASLWLFTFPLIRSHCVIYS